MDVGLIHCTVPRSFSGWWRMLLIYLMMNWKDERYNE